MSSFKFYTFTQRPERADEADHVNMAVWPELMLHDPIADACWGVLMTDLAEYQFMLCDEADTIVGVGFTIPLVWEPGQELPDTGWDWVIQKGVRDFKAGRTPTALSAISAAVMNGHQGKGISTEIIRGMRSIAQQHGLPYVIAPVRPNWKSRYPLTPMARYITWQNADGLPYDPWLRVHARLGARITKVAPRSMKISGRVVEWERWADMRFPESGKYTIPGALNPVTIHLEKDRGVYVEPNVWMVHNLV